MRGVQGEQCNIEPGKAREGALEHKVCKNGRGATEVYIISVIVLYFTIDPLLRHPGHLLAGNFGKMHMADGVR